MMQCYQLNQHKNVHVIQVSGVEYFSCDVSERMLTLIVMPPLDACTYMGVDSGVAPIQVRVLLLTIMNTGVATIQLRYIHLT